MKKFLSLLIIFSTTTITCMSTAIASFVVDSTEMIHHNMMQKEMTMPSSGCCETMKGDCEERTHECCISPFNDSGVVSNTYNPNEKKELLKGKTLDISFLSLIQTLHETNNAEKRDPPPVLPDPLEINHFYITLIGSTKSNC